MGNAYAVIKDGTVINMVVWDGVKEWQPAEGVAVPAPDYVGIGWRYEDEKFIDPNAPVQPDNGEVLSARMSELAEQLRVDVERMNLAYLSAIVVEGAAEDAKVAKIRQEISLRKQKYKDDMAALILEYGD